MSDQTNTQEIVDIIITEFLLDYPGRYMEYWATRIADLTQDEKIARLVIHTLYTEVFPREVFIDHQINKCMDYWRDETRERLFSRVKDGVFTI